MGDTNNIIPRYNENERKTKVQEFLDLRKKGLSIDEACLKVDVSRDSIYKWAEKYGYGDLRTKKTKLTNIIYRDKPKTTTNQATDNFKRREGKVIVIVGDVNSVKEAIGAAFNALND